MPNLLVTFYVFLSVILSVQSTLVSVHVIFRHGARAPVLNVTSEEARSHFYRGLGQLTDEGIEQARVIGTLLRERYVDTQFLDARMISSEVLFRSSPVERCLMTIQTVGNTMFPNATPPVQTMPRNEDFLLLPKFDCPFLYKDYQKSFNLTEKELAAAKKNIWDISERALRKAAAQTDLLKNRADENIPALMLEKKAGLAVPAWFDDQAYHEAEYVFYSALSVMSSVGEYYSPEGIKPKSGYLLDTVLKNINQTVKCHRKNKTNCGKKFQAFSSHDILVLSLLESFGVREAALGKDRAPNFLATIIIETYIINEQPFVKLIYRRDPKDPDNLILTGNVRNCPANKEFCEAQRFTSCCDDFLTSDPETQCYGSHSNWSMTPLSWILAVVAFIFLVLIVVLVLFVFRFRNRNSINLKV